MLRHYATSCKAEGSVPGEDFGLFNLPNPSGPWGPAKPLTNVYTESSGGEMLPVRKADNLTAISEPIV
jgi:hypothetical protein